MTTLALHLDAPYGVMTAVESIDYDTGTARYEVTAPRVSGVFVIRPPHYGDDPIPTDLGVWYGDGPPTANDCDRTSRPVVNGVLISGGTVFANPAAFAAITRWRVNAQIATSRYTSRSAPDKTTERIAAVVRALLGHYWNRPDRRAIIRAAARHDAAARLADERRAISRLRATAEEVNTELADHTRRAALLSRLAAEHARHSRRRGHQHTDEQQPGNAA